ncbi:MAG: hypothetical protein OQL19_10380 [Gammaproteobacteria bacterium]|nr:hypothetical protein [Gammaproteobacteria bacterium]
MLKEHHKQRKIYIYCDGGFGNRFNSLVTGLTISRIFNLDAVAVWPENNVCMATFDDLLDKELANLEVLSLEEFNKIESEIHLQPMIHESNGHLAAESVMLKNDLNQLYVELIKSDADILFSTNLIPPYLDLGLISTILDQIRFEKNIYEKVNSFLSQQETTQFFGLHMRKTDFGENPEHENGLRNLILQNPDKVFFVCSDSQLLEEELNKQDNVFCLPKNSYVEKLVDGEWRHNFKHHDGRNLRFNVNRTTESVKEAMLDLLVLSESEIIDTSHSTFLKTALLLRAKKRGLLKFGEHYGKHY